MIKGNQVYAFLLFIVVVFLNFDFLAQNLLGKSDLLNSWVIVPAGMMLIYVVASLLKNDISDVTWIVMLFIFYPFGWQCSKLAFRRLKWVCLGGIVIRPVLGVFLWMQQHREPICSS